MSFKLNLHPTRFSCRALYKRLIVSSGDQECLILGFGKLDLILTNIHGYLLKISLKSQSKCLVSVQHEDFYPQGMWNWNKI